MISAILACKIREATYYLCLTELKHCSSLLQSKQKLSRRRARERERETERKRERGVCAHWESKTLCLCGSTGSTSQKLNKVWLLFLMGKKSPKGSAMLLSWQHCAYPFLQLRVGPRVKQKIRAELIAR